jgi:hypothetical protein
MALSKAWHSKNTRTVITLGIIVVLVLSVFLGLGLYLNTGTPVRVVESSSMCIPNNTVSGPPYTFDQFLWTVMHPFNRTLNVGDIIIIQGVDPKTLNTAYPNSDIIVYNDPTSSDPTDPPIVHRIVGSYTENGTIYFYTKGDGNPGEVWPNPVPSSDYDSNRVWDVNTGKGVPSNLVEGKVIMRIPLLGWITLFFRTVSWGWPLIVVVIVLLVILEFVLPVIKRKPQQNSENNEINI